MTKCMYIVDGFGWFWLDPANVWVPILRHIIIIIIITIIIIIIINNHQPQIIQNPSFLGLINLGQ